MVESLNIEKLRNSQQQIYDRLDELQKERTRIIDEINGLEDEVRDVNYELQEALEEQWTKQV